MRLLAIFFIALHIPIALGYLAQPIQSYDGDTNDFIVNTTLSVLESVAHSNLTKCLKCKTTLSIGKELALTQPQLVPEVFTKLCIAKGGDQQTCLNTYGRTTVNHSYWGSDFANLLTLMDPISSDGDYFCYFKYSSACPLPETPKIDISSWWPPKSPEYQVSPEPSNETFKVLHVSDFHIELNYTIGSEGNCSQGMCGAAHSYNYHSTPENYNFTTALYEGVDAPEDISFYEGSYYDSSGNFIKGNFTNIAETVNQSIWDPVTSFGCYYCDAPEILINSSLKSISEFQQSQNIDFEFTIFTGDLVDHDEVYFISHNSTIEAETRIFRDLKFFLQDSPVYSVMGNHDTFPYGQLAQESTGYSNLYDWNAELMSEMWKDYGWIDQETAQVVKTHYTGFSVTTKRGLKIITLNSNCWYIKNLYAYWDTNNLDSFGQFDFLVQELIESEQQGQRVWILAHIPVGTSNILPIPSNIFSQIIERFSPYTIANIFFGHTHTDQFQIFYSGNGTETSKNLDNIVNFAWISQSITPQSERNPSWRYYEVDTKTFSIMDSVNFFTELNATFANLGEEPEWKFEYKARETYDPASQFSKNHPLNATFWHHVAENIKTNVTWNQIYSDLELRNSPFVPDCATSDDCEDNYCYITSFTPDQYNLCLAEQK